MGRALGTASGNVASVSSGDFEGVLYRARVRWRESREELTLAANASLNFRYYGTTEVVHSRCYERMRASREKPLR